MELTTLIMILGIGQGFFLGLILLTIRRGNCQANRILGILLLLIAYSITPMVFTKLGIFYAYPHLYKTAQPLLFLFGPLFLVYTKILTDKSYRLNWKKLGHALPFILFVLYLSPVYLMNKQEKIAYLGKMLGSSFNFDYVFTPLQIGHLFIYIFVVHRLVRKHVLNIKKSFSTIDKINLDWLKRGIWGFVTIFVIMAVSIIIQVSVYPAFRQFSGDMVAILVSLVIYYIGYKGLQQPEIFVGGEEREPAGKYEKSTLDQAKALTYKQRLLDYMVTDKPFLNSLLTIKDLAGKINIPTYHLSQVINEHFQQNFFDFINSYRINQAKERLRDPRSAHLSIQGIAYEVGFNSKSAFNNAFKRYTNKTPSEFRNQIS